MLFWSLATSSGFKMDTNTHTTCVPLVYGVTDALRAVLSPVSVGWTVCENDRTCQQIASLLPLWLRTMGHHMLKWGNEWSSFVLAPRALASPDPKGGLCGMGADTHRQAHSVPHCQAAVHSQIAQQGQDKRTTKESRKTNHFQQWGHGRIWSSLAMFQILLFQIFDILMVGLQIFFCLFLFGVCAQAWETTDLGW